MMKSPLTHGIRAQLLVLLLMLALPFVAYLTVSYLRHAEADRQQAGQRMLGGARVTAARLDDHVGDIQQMLKVLSHVVGTSAADVAANDALLQGLTNDLPPHINDISVWDTNGDNIGSMNEGARKKPFNIKASASFKAAMLARAVSVDGPIKSPINGRWVGIFTVPVIRDDLVVAVVSASTRLSRLQDMLTPNSTLPQGVVITVTDDFGKTLARSVDPDKWIGVNQLATPDIKSAIGQREGMATTTDADGTPRMAGFTMSARLPWLVYVSAPSDSVLSDLRKRTRETLVAGFALFVFAALAALWVSDRIARPLRQLSDDATLIGEGKLDHRTTMRAGGEAGVLAATLNRMAEALQERNASLERSQEQLRQITDNVPALVSYLDTERRFVFANRAYQDWLNADPKDMIGKTLAQQYGDSVYANIAPHIDKAMGGERVVYERELETIIGPKYVQVTAVPHFDHAGRVQGLYVLMHDITQRKINEERLRQLAEFDLLTGLPNRGLFLDRLKQGMAKAEGGGVPMGLLLLDIDYFKLVNDTHGHAAGDDLLRAFARRLLDSVRPTDTVARLSGDEFAIVLLDVADMQTAALVAAKIVSAIRVPMTVREVELDVTTSVGVALCLPGEHDGPQLIARADAALYRAKAAGRDTYYCERRETNAASTAV